MNTILTDDELPPLQPHDHPEPHSFAWTEQEMRAIRARDRLVEAAVLAKLREQEPQDISHVGQGLVDVWKSRAAPLPAVVQVPQTECWACSGTGFVTTSSNGSGLIEEACSACATPEAPAQASQQADLSGLFLQAMEWGRDHWASFSMRGEDHREIAEQFADKALSAAPEAPATAVVQVPQGWRDAVMKAADELDMEWQMVEGIFHGLLPLFMADKNEAGFVTIPIDSLIESDSYGVHGSDFYRCKVCGAESGAGLLNKGIEHNFNCPLAAAPEAPATAAVQVPAGYKLVPVKPTPEMMDAAVKAICYGPQGGFTRISGPYTAWTAMLAAAPEAPAQADPLEKLTRIQEELGLYGDKPAQAEQAAQPVRDERAAFEAWANDYALTAEPNYSQATKADCWAAFRAGATFASTERQPSVPAPWREAMKVALGALEIAEKFCKGFTAEDCSDSVYIPISEAKTRLEKLTTALDSLSPSKADEVLKNFEIQGPDDEGLLWLVLHGNGTTGKAMFNLGRGNKIAGKLALLLEQDRRAAIALADSLEGGE